MPTNDFLPVLGICRVSILLEMSRGLKFVSVMFRSSNEGQAAESGQVHRFDCGGHTLNPKP